MHVFSRTRRLFREIAFVCAFSLVLPACNENKEYLSSDRPRLNSKVAMRDVTFHSAALRRDMPYRAILSVNLPQGSKLPVVYLLHGGGGNFRDWSNNSDVARFAERGLILVMPEGDESYYTNSVEHPQDRYEDYIVSDLIADVEKRFPAASNRANRAIVGISMGGFGAVKIALRHPDLFAFVGGLSSALDVPSRPFSVKRIGQWRHHRSIFGPWGSSTRHDNDPFVLGRSADVTAAPYFFLTCGEQEGLLPTNHQFANLLQQRRFRHEFHVVPGGHNWNQWNSRLDDCFRSLFEHLR
jgi:putative tributyrin esterase